MLPIGAQRPGLCTVGVPLWRPGIPDTSAQPPRATGIHLASGVSSLVTPEDRVFLPNTPSPAPFYTATRLKPPTCLGKPRNQAECRVSPTWVAIASLLSLSRLLVQKPFNLLGSVSSPALWRLGYVSLMDNCRLCWPISPSPILWYQDHDFLRGNHTSLTPHPCSSLHRKRAADPGPSHRDWSREGHVTQASPMVVSPGIPLKLSVLGSSCQGRIRKSRAAGGHLYLGHV